MSGEFTQLLCCGIWCVQPTKAGEKSKTALSEIYKTFFGGKAEVFWVGLTQVCFEGE